MKLALSLANLPDEYKDLALQQCDRAIEEEYFNLDGLEAHPTEEISGTGILPVQNRL